jgi:hypothetical protein
MAPAPQLKNTLSFIVAAGASIVLPHGLSNGMRPLAPDAIFIPGPDLEVTASDEVSITLANNGGSEISGTVLVEAWHTIERAFGDAANVDLPVKPYVVVSVEGNGQPPIPPFAVTETIIYANQTGNDVTGRGTQLLPYLTFQRAVRDIPAFIPPGARYILDITNLGDEMLPEGFELPAWVASDFIFPFPDNAVTIRADMKPAAILSPSARVFTPSSSAQNPTALVWSVTDGTQAWPNLKGYYLVWDGGELGGVIHENTGTTLQFSGDEIPFGEMAIVEPSARLIGNWQIHCSASLLIFGVAIEPVNPGDGSVTISNTETWMDRCTVKEAFFAAPVYRHYTFNCDLTACSWSGPFYCSGSYVKELSFEAFEAPPYMIFKSGTVFEDLSTITPVNLDPAWSFGTNLLMDSVLIKNAIGDGVLLVGGVAIINSTEVNNCGGNAFTFSGPGKYTLTNVGGNGSAGVGIRVDEGAQVQTISPVTVTGSNGQQVGDLAAGGYPATPYNIVDVFGGVNPNITGTGSRLFNK